MKMLSMRTVVSFFLFIAMWSNTSAQFTLSGTVSAEDRSRLESATIYFVNTEIASVTEFDGTFLIEDIPAGKYQMEVSYLGYEDYVEEITIDRDMDVTIVLNGSFYNLSEIEVKGSRTEATKPFTYTIVDKPYLDERNNGQDVPFLLGGLTNVITTSDAGAGIGYTSMRLRGSDQSRINVTINGVPLNDAESQSVFWVDLPDFANSVEDIQVQRGVGTSTNGPGAFGGTVALNTHTIHGDAYADFSGTLGSFNTNKVSLKLGTGILNDRFTIDARYSLINSDGYIDRSNSKLNSWMISPAMFWEDAMIRLDIFSGHEITNQAWYGVPQAKIENDQEGLINHYFNNLGSIYETQRDSVNLFDSDRRYNYYTYENQVDDYQQDHIQAHFYKTFSERLNSRLTAFYTHGFGFFEEYKNNEFLPHYGIEGYLVNGDTIRYNDIVRRRGLDNNLLGFFTNNEANLSEKYKLEFGGGISRYKGEHQGLLINIVDVQIPTIGVPYYFNEGIKLDYNLYAKNNVKLSDHFFGMADLQIRGVDYSILGSDNDGLQIDEEHQYFFFNPKAGVTYLKDSIRSYISLAVGGREPDRNDIINSIGITDVRPERLYNLELGVEPTFKHIALKANLYYMYYIDQLVLTGELNDVGSNLRTNVDRSYRAGIELEANTALTSWLNLHANASFSRNRIEEFNEVLYNYKENDPTEIIVNTYNDTDIAFSPQFVGGGELRAKLPKDIFLNFGAKYVSTQQLDNTGNPDRIIPSYFVSNLSAFYRPQVQALKRLEVGLHVNNLFNTLYSANGYTYSYGYEGFFVTENFYYPQATRYFMLTANVRI